ncbi:DUF2474 family protein [Pigmentiphaga sp.]|jgi:Protein of unknown function (DUF2474).|nr:DUF2474 family protein [Pigmentiphaga sp.]MBX6320100.1 DUF2474 family protein [Pigmentiphaga sp.]
MNHGPGAWRRRLAWLVLLWAGGVAALAALAALLKLAMRAAGLA